MCVNDLYEKISCIIKYGINQQVTLRVPADFKFELSGFWVLNYVFLRHELCVSCSRFDNSKVTIVRTKTTHIRTYIPSDLELATYDEDLLTS